MKNRLVITSYFKPLSILVLSLSLVACGDRSWWSKNNEPTLESDQIKRILPPRVNDRSAWADDIFNITEQLGIPQSKENIWDLSHLILPRQIDG